MKNKKTYWFLIVSSTAFSWIGWAMLYRSLYLATNHYWLYPIIGFFISLTFLTIFIAVEQSKKVVTSVVLLSTFPTVIVAKFFGLFMIPVWALCSFLILIGIERMRKQQHLRIKFHPHALVRYGMPFISTALALMISANYFFAIKDQEVAGETPQFHVTIPSRIVYASLHWSSRIFPGEAMRAIDSGQTVDEFIQTNTRNTSRGSYLEEVMASLDQAQDRQLTDEEKNELQKRLRVLQADVISRDLARSDLSKQLGVELQGGEQMRDVFVRLVNQKVDQFFNHSDDSKDTVPDEHHGGALPYHQDHQLGFELFAGLDSGALFHYNGQIENCRAGTGENGCGADRMMAFLGS